MDSLILAITNDDVNGSVEGMRRLFTDERASSAAVFSKALGILPSHPDVLKGIKDIFRDGTLSPYPEEEASLRSLMAEVYFQEGNLLMCASTLVEARVLECGSWSADRKVSIMVKAAECFLEEGDMPAGDTASMKVCGCVEEVGEPSLKLRYYVTRARILDYKKKYSEAANMFYRLSKNEYNLEIDPADLQQLFEDACVCCILSEAHSYARKFLASELLKDSRMNELGMGCVLEKLVVGAVISKTELEEVEQYLKVHQKRTDDGRSSLVVTGQLHNLGALSNEYQIITLEAMSRLLQMTVEETEKMSARLISKGVLKGSINQRNSVITFQPIDRHDTVVQIVDAVKNFNLL